MVDIGAGTTDIAIYSGGALRHTASLAIGGDQVTSDLAQLLRTPTAHAEELKVRYACALAQSAHAEETIQVPSVGDRPTRRLARQNLAEAVQPRYEEIFEMVQADLRRSGREEWVHAGIVLTGGAARMEGALDLAEELFHMPVRLGSPKYTGSLADVVQNPRFATACGLLLEAQAQRKRGQKLQEKQGISDVIKNMTSWLAKNF
jgi:cell division protein FtsA